MSADDSIALGALSVDGTQDLIIDGNAYADTVEAKTEILANGIKFTLHDHVSGSRGQPTSPPRP